MKRYSRLVGIAAALVSCGVLALATHAQQGHNSATKPAGIPNGGYAGYDASRSVTLKVVPGGLQADLGPGVRMDTVMDAATLKVTVSPAMTTFSDAKGHCYTVYAHKHEGGTTR